MSEDFCDELTMAMQQHPAIHMAWVHNGAINVIRHDDDEAAYRHPRTYDLNDPGVWDRLSADFPGIVFPE